MARAERQRQVLELLTGLKGLEPLKQLFWSELNYQRVNQPLSRRGWPERATEALADDPVLFASGGDGGAFHVTNCRLTTQTLSRGLERPVVPIATADANQPLAIEQIADKILCEKKKNPNSNLMLLEEKIENMVYDICGLTPNEIKFVEDLIT